MDDWDSDLVPQQFETSGEMRLSSFCNAAQEGDITKMQHMLDNKLIHNVNQQSPKRKETALHYACKHGVVDRMKVIKYLVGLGADINLKDTRGKHSLHLCCSGGYLEAAKYLLEKKAVINYVDKYGRSCLHWAAVNKHYEVVVALLDAGAPLTYAVSNNWQPLHEAVKGGDFKIVELLINKGAPVNLPFVDGKVKTTVTPLHIAAREGHEVVVKLLIENKAHVNAVNQGKQTPLHEAAFKGSRECCSLLLLKGADPHAKNNQERTPLLEACNQGKLNCAILLLDAGSHVNKGDRCGETALHHLIRHNQERLEPEQLASFADVLLQYGANPNLRGMEDETPIMLANLMMDKDVTDVIFTAMEKPRTLLHLAKISSRRILGCHYESVKNIDIPKSLQKYLLQNSSYFSGW